MAFYVYILKCADGAYYTGHTDNPDVRLASHRAAQSDSWVTKRLPVELVFIEAAPTREEALAFEQQVKRWSRAKKEALIVRDWERLQLLAKSYSSFAVHGSTSSPRTGVSGERAFSAELAEASPRTGVSSYAKLRHETQRPRRSPGRLSPVRGELVEP
ncbi:MAG: GIY-YIG nuclease family protein [Betaproteobacteria bacterium]|nr:MAG: GIY-YIG nuclease family protein [Betaproteobacteria bacterium]